MRRCIDFIRKRRENKKDKQERSLYKFSDKLSGSYSNVLISQDENLAAKIMKRNSTKTAKVENIEEDNDFMKKTRKSKYLVGIHGVEEILIEVDEDDTVMEKAIIMENGGISLMEYLEEPLNNWTLFEQRGVEHVLYSILKAIDELHNLGYMHRDIKPDNILIKGKQVKLCDFNLSTANKHDNIPLGSLNCTAPEVFKAGKRNAGEGKHGKYDKKVDIYSFAMTMFYIIEGIYPYEKYFLTESGEFASEMDNYSTHTHVVELSLGFEDDVDELCSSDHWNPKLIALFRATCKVDPAERPTADEVLEEFFDKKGRLL